MPDLDSAIHWRQYSVAIVLAIFIALFSLSQFGLLLFSPSTDLGCFFLFLSLSWDIYVMKLTQSRKKIGPHGTIADGLLMMGLIFVFIGAFF